MGTLTQNPFAPKPTVTNTSVGNTPTVTQTQNLAGQNPFRPGYVQPTPTTTTQQTSTINPFATLGIINPQSNLSGNPMPTNTSGGAPSSVQNFLDTFRFQNPTSGSAQFMFNDIATKYGTNAAWSWALNDAWNYLGGWGEQGLPRLMADAGISNDDRHRIINTYGSSMSNYWDGYKHDMTALGNPFNPTSPYAGYRTQINALHPSNITTNIGNNTTTTPTPETNNTTTNPIVNNTAQTTNTPQYAQGATNFQGYNPYANNNLAGNPYSTTGIQPVTGLTTTNNSTTGDTSIQQTPITGVS